MLIAMLVDWNRFLSTKLIKYIGLIEFFYLDLMMHPMHANSESDSWHDIMRNLGSFRCVQPIA